MKYVYLFCQFFMGKDTEEKFEPEYYQADIWNVDAHFFFH